MRPNPDLALRRARDGGMRLPDIHEAAKRGDVGAVKKFLAQDASEATQRNDDHRTPLHPAMKTLLKRHGAQ